MVESPDLSVVVPTFNRADELALTLDAMERVRTDGLRVEFVIVDNRSTDHTREVVDARSARLPLRYLHEPRPGKNRALNHALEASGLGRVIVFTDDDVTPDPQWLQAIQQSASACPGAAAFGGRVWVRYPIEPVPPWALDEEILGWAFARLDLGEAPCPWPERRFPSGPNYWIRRELVDAGFRFDDSLGPRPKRRILGDESAFLKRIRDAGHRIRYEPNAIVHHRIQPELVSVRGIRRRAFQVGRASPHVWGPNRPRLLRRSRLLWSALRLVALARAATALGASFATLDSVRRLIRSTDAIRSIAYNVESLRLAWAAVAGADESR